MIEKISTGVEGLDQITGGGLLRGSAYIVQGPPGAGKTILANQFCYAHVRAGGRALYMSLLAESSARMLNYVSQMAFFDANAVPAQMEYISGYGVLEREGLPGLLKLVQHELKRHQASVMVLDGTFVVQSVASEQEFRSFIHTLQGVASMAGAVLLMLTHQSREPGSPEHTMVDGWIEMEHETLNHRSVQTIQVRKHRGARILGGKHQLRISAKGIEVFPRIETILGETPAPIYTTDSVSTGLGDIDRLLAGGLPANSATLLLGPTGSGKTTMSTYFAAQATPEEPTLVLSFYESPSRIRARARQLSFDTDHVLNDNVLRLLWLPPSELIVDEVAHEVLRQAREIGAKRVVIDGIIALRDSLVHRGRFPYFINALSLQLREIGATSVYTQESAELEIDTTMPSDELSAMVDNIIALTISRRRHASQRYISIVKMRDRSFDPRNHPFHVGAHGLVLGEDPAIAPAGQAD